MSRFWFGFSTFWLGCSIYGALLDWHLAYGFGVVLNAAGAFGHWRLG